jgi:hypothetical protein
MDNKIIFLLVVLAFIIYNSRSNFAPVSNQPVIFSPVSTYTNEPSENMLKSCDFKNEYRVYPSGKVPGSYLGLSQREKDILFKRFVEYKLPDLEGN